MYSGTFELSTNRHNPHTFYINPSTITPHTHTTHPMCPFCWLSAAAVECCPGSARGCSANERAAQVCTRRNAWRRWGCHVFQEECEMSGATSNTSYFARHTPAPFHQRLRGGSQRGGVESEIQKNKTEMQRNKTEIRCENFCQGQGMQRM